MQHESARTPWRTAKVLLPAPENNLDERDVAERVLNQSPHKQRRSSTRQYNSIHTANKNAGNLLVYIFRHLIRHFFQKIIITVNSLLDLWDFLPALLVRQD